jgi:hypothetical protein
MDFHHENLTVFRAIVLDNLDRIVEAWHEHCGE